MNKKRFFLEEVVDYTFKKYPDFKNLNVIFPNRRAGLYFQKALSKKINKSVWSPSVYTMEDFIQKYSKIKISNDYIFYISIVIFFSPYFRSTSVWLLGDNLAIIFFSLSILFFIKSVNDAENLKNYFLCLLFLMFLHFYLQFENLV